ncbi:hypothetical protein EDB80DRAFT_215627 [Ilyonectria destructans]|nr:hypothetical protein EDB80DRAFT_215627 [Ilyonectria destructans]
MCHGCIKKATSPRLVRGKTGTWGCVPALTILADFGVVRFGDVKLSELGDASGEGRNGRVLKSEGERRNPKRRSPVLALGGPPVPRRGGSFSCLAVRAFRLCQTAPPCCSSVLPSLARSCPSVNQSHWASPPVASLGWSPLAQRQVPRGYQAVERPYPTLPISRWPSTALGRNPASGVTSNLDPLRPLPSF